MPLIPICFRGVRTTWVHYEDDKDEDCTDYMDPLNEDLVMLLYAAGEIVDRESVKNLPERLEE